MWIFELLRKIPTPQYGKCGGASRDCAPIIPIDWMDVAFAKHDNDLYKTNKIVDDELRMRARKLADKNLFLSLKSGDSKELKLWGRIYRRLSMVIFGAFSND